MDSRSSAVRPPPRYRMAVLAGLALALSALGQGGLAQSPAGGAALGSRAVPDTKSISERVGSGFTIPSDCTPEFEKMYR